MQIGLVCCEECIHTWNSFCSIGLSRFQSIHKIDACTRSFYRQEIKEKYKKSNIIQIVFVLPQRQRWFPMRKLKPFERIHWQRVRNTGCNYAIAKKLISRIGFRTRNYVHTRPSNRQRVKFTVSRYANQYLTFVSLRLTLIYSKYLFDILLSLVTLDVLL